MTTLDQYEGCLLGLALGDATGAPYEGGILERLLWRALGTTGGLPRWTDDTQMALDLAQSLLECRGLQPHHLAQRFASSYRWSRGYGPGTAKVLKRIAKGQDWAVARQLVYPGGSYGNGGAMRASVTALFETGSDTALATLARESAAVTHAHPLATDGAALIATATRCMLQRQSTARTLATLQALPLGGDFPRRLQQAAQWLNTPEAEPASTQAPAHASTPPTPTPTPATVARHLGNGMTATTSCVTAVYLALQHVHQPFGTLMQAAIACRGDTDTIAAMAGTLWGAYRGASALPTTPLEQRDHITAVAQALWSAAQEPQRM